MRFSDAYLSKASTKESLKVFRLAFFVAAASLLILSFISRTFGGVQGAEFLSAASLVMLFCGLSIGAWLNSKAQVLEEFLVKTMSDTENYLKVFVLVSASLVLLLAVVAEWLGSSVNEYYGTIGIFFLIGFLAIIIIPIVGNAFSPLVILGPALAALAYLWLAIFFAKAIVAFGGTRLKNTLIIYMVVATAYLALLSLPGLRAWLNVPAFCQ